MPKTVTRQRRDCDLKSSPHGSRVVCRCDVEDDDSACRCSGRQCPCRWACVAALGLLGCLPCLLLYWPLRALLGAVRAVRAAAATRRHACRCRLAAAADMRRRVQQLHILAADQADNQ